MCHASLCIIRRNPQAVPAYGLRVVTMKKGCYPCFVAMKDNTPPRGVILIKHPSNNKQYFHNHRLADEHT
jgi:hypothetical protein